MKQLVYNVNKKAFLAKDLMARSILRVSIEPEKTPNTHYYHIVHVQYNPKQ